MQRYFKSGNQLIARQLGINITKKELDQGAEKVRPRVAVQSRLAHVEMAGRKELVPMLYN